MEKLFQIETYDGCHITCPDPGTIVVEGVGGHFLRVRFQQRIMDWAVEIHVSVSAPLITARWLTLVCGEPVTDDQKRFWYALLGLYSRDSAECEDKLIRASRNILGASS